MTIDYDPQDEPVVAVSTESPEIRTARQILARLATQPGPHGPEAAVTLAVIDTVRPPYPPIRELPPDVVIPLFVAIEALRAAIRVASTMPEAIRLAEAALELPATDES